MDSHLDLIEGRLTGSDTLHKKSGRGDDLNEEVLAVFTCDHNKLKADAHHEWQNSDLNERTVKDVIPRNNWKRTDNDTDKNYNEHKGRSATRMKTLILFDVLGSELLARLVTEDGLMLCAVIFKCSVISFISVHAAR